MRYAVTTEHLSFFRREGYIAFDLLLNRAQMNALKEPFAHLSKLPTPAERYLAGRDLFRDSPEIQSIVMRANWAKIAAALFQEDNLKLAYTEHIYKKLPFDENLCLKDVSCFSEIYGGALFNLATGGAVYLSPTCPLAKTGSFTENAELLLIVYMGMHGRYLLLPGDPCVHYLKKLGYSFGDMLGNETHPLILAKGAENA